MHEREHIAATNGPAEADLTWFTVRIEDGEVIVDPTQVFAKGTFTLH